MTIQQAIEKAIQGGWRIPGYAKENGATYIADEMHYRALLDPLFWQALGTSMGWDTKAWKGSYSGEPWKDHWHRLIDHLAEGGTVEEFFEKLTNNYHEGN